MNRLAFLLAPAVALAVSLAPARRDDSADRTGRVRFSHQRHQRWLPDCEFCHRRRAPEADGNPTPWLEFARPTEASCLCHRLPAAVAPARPPGTPDTPFAPAPGGAPEAGAKQAASPVPHALRGREDCLLCHALDGMSPVPADHAGFGNQTCTDCHAPPAAPPSAEAAADERASPTPPPQARPFIEDPVPEPTALLPPLGQPLAEQPPRETETDGIDLDAGGDIPQTEVPVARATTPPTFVPHVVDGLPGCTSCHRPRGLRPIPADHVDYADETCTTCHVVVPRPQSVAAREGPDAPVCALCHPVGADHRLALPALAAPPESGLVFSHAEHDAAAPASCETCHSLAQADAQRPPSMQLCMSCHQDAMTRCARCHLADARGRLVTDLPDGRRLVPTAWWGATAHLADWDTTHDVAAWTDGEMCRNCHEQPFCEGCHLGLSTEGRFHGAGWLTLHGPAGRSSDLTCDTCHDRQGTCLACHRRAGVAADSPTDAVPAGAGRYHPADWTFADSGHPREARRDLGTCISCHSEGHCFTCHRGINPHGESFFQGSCNMLRRANRGLCLECHATVPRCGE